MENVTHRLRVFVDHTNLSVNAFEIACKLGKRKIDNALNRGTDFGFSTLEKIVNKFPSLNLNWLITGRGNMLLDGLEPSVDESKSMQVAELQAELLACLRENKQLQKKIETTAVGCSV